MFQKHSEFKRIWKGSSLKSNEQNTKGKFFLNDDTNQNTCYRCELLSNTIKYCQNIKKKKERTKFKSKRVDKRAMAAMWSDSDSSKTESKDEKSLPLSYG